MTVEEFMGKEKKMCDEHEEIGVDPIMFWAGRMSHGIQRLITLSMFDISEQIRLLKFYADNYDNLIIRKALKK